MNSRTSVRILSIILLIISANLIDAQNHYNIRKFRVYVPPGWKMEDHDVNYLAISSTKTMFLLYFNVIDNDDIETKWSSILNSLGRRLDFGEEITDKGGYDLENGLHVIYGFCDVTIKDGGEKVKFISSQIVNDKDYTILIYGFCDLEKFGYYRNSLRHIYENIRYKED